jgi:hypothetical protein
MIHVCAWNLSLDLLTMSSDPQLLASLPANDVEDEKSSYVFSVPEFESQYCKEFSLLIIVQTDRHCGLVVRVLDYRSGGPGSISGTTKKKSSRSGTESTQPREYNWVATWHKSSVSCLENREYGRRDPSRCPLGTLYPQRLAITSPTIGGRSVGIVRSRTQTIIVQTGFRAHSAYCSLNTGGKKCLKCVTCLSEHLVFWTHCINQRSVWLARGIVSGIYTCKYCPVKERRVFSEVKAQFVSLLSLRLESVGRKRKRFNELAQLLLLLCLRACVCVCVCVRQTLHERLPSAYFWKFLAQWMVVSRSVVAAKGTFCEDVNIHSLSPAVRERNTADANWVPLRKEVFL